MDRIGYGIRDAAAAASVSEHAIKVAVREGALPTRMLCGERVILHDDLRSWAVATSDELVSV